jgi:hypothetical protein
MPELTRRRSLDHRNECWHIYYGDIHAGTIAIRSGKPLTTPLCLFEAFFEKRLINLTLVLSHMYF